MGDAGLRQRPDTRGDRHQAGTGRPGVRELLVDLGEQGRVAVDDPAGDLLVAGPAGVLHEFGTRFAGRLGGEPDRIVIASGDLGDLRPLRGDGRDRGGVHAAGHEHVRPLPQEPGHPGQRPPVVAVGGGHQRQRPGGVPPGQHPVNRPGSAEHLESRQAHPGRLVLHEHPSDAQFGCDGRYLRQRGGRVAGQPGVKGPCLGGGSGSAGPRPGSRPREPGRAARRQVRGSDHPPTMPSRRPCRLDEVLHDFDVLPAVDGGDSSCAAHAALRRVPASAPAATSSGGLTPVPQAFSLSLRPRARMFLAAFTSRSWTSRTPRRSTGGRRAAWGRP